MAGLCETFCLRLCLMLFICASSTKFDLENLESVEMFGPLLKGGALRNLSIKSRILIRQICCNLRPLSLWLLHRTCIDFDLASRFSSLHAEFELVFSVQQTAINKFGYLKILIFQLVLASIYSTSSLTKQFLLSSKGFNN